MKTLFVVFITLFTCSAVSAKDILLFNSDIYGQPTSTNQALIEKADPFLVKMFDYAKDHNISALEDLRDNIITRQDQSLLAAYYLALYIAAPDKYKQQYVDNFPVDDGIMNNYYARIELNRLTPSFLYSFNALGLIAAEDNPKAIEKIVIGVNHSDGIAAEEFCDLLIKTFDKQMAETIKTLSRIDKGVRQETYSCIEMMNTDEYSAFKKT